MLGFYGISTIVGYLMPNPLYTYILNIYDLVWFDFMTYQPLLVYGGARGVMVIVAGYGHGDTSSNPGPD